ncbi:unnamed protein product, partial [Hapterophycus canaliculatus]
MAHAWPREPRSRLHRAAASGSVSKVKALLASGLVDINGRDPAGNTPLVYAIKEHPRVVATLLDAGADANVPNDSGATSLHWTAMLGQPRTAQMLIEAGALLEVTDGCGCTPLQLAGEGGHAEVIRALVDAGANINSRSSLGETALYSAAYLGNVDATKELLRANANPLLGTVSGAGETEVVRLPLDVAAQHGHEGVVDELLRLGIGACGAVGGDALLLASKWQHL